jgi:hypothetical protein
MNTIEFYAIFMGILEKQTLRKKPTKWQLEKYGKIERMKKKHESKILVY